jgi:hypothetical protein
MVKKVVEQKIRERRLQNCNKGIEMRNVRVTMEDVVVFMDPIDLADVPSQVKMNRHQGRKRATTKSAYIGIYPIRIQTLHFNIPNFWLTSDAFCPLKINRYLESESQESKQSEDTSDTKVSPHQSDESRSDRRLKSMCGTITVPTTGMQMKLGKMKVDASMGNEILPTIVLKNIVNNIPNGHVSVDLKPMCKAINELPDKVMQEVLTAIFGEEAAKSIMGDLGKAWKDFSKKIEDGANDLYDDTIGKIIPRPWRRMAGSSDIQYSIPVPSSKMILYDGASSTGPAVEMHFAPIPVLGSKISTKVQIDPIKIYGFEVQLPSFKPRPWRRMAGSSDIQYSIPVPSSKMTLYDGASSTGPAVEMHFAPIPVLGSKRSTKVQIDPIKIYGFEVQLPSFKIDATLLSAKDMQSFVNMIDDAMPILI